MFEIFSYDPVSGVMVNKITNNILIGATVTVNGAKYEKSHVIWFICYGKLPPKGYVVDHIDRDRTNYKLSNLRLATVQQNAYNQRKLNTILKGVTIEASRSKPYRAQIRINGKKVNLGRFHTPKEAADAYREAAIKYHGEFADHD